MKNIESNSRDFTFFGLYDSINSRIISFENNYQILREVIEYNFNALKNFSERISSAILSISNFENSLRRSVENFLSVFRALDSTILNLDDAYLQDIFAKLTGIVDNVSDMQLSQYNIENTEHSITEETNEGICDTSDRITNISIEIKDKTKPITIERVILILTFLVQLLTSLYPIFVEKDDKPMVNNITYNIEQIINIQNDLCDYIEEKQKIEPEATEENVALESTEEN